ncbi:MULTISPECIES: hypothetical protein [unclassified Polaribacter]|uniref:hypothetical protein n=1 Tax=unclassified Polaribacter TaxID=196858 RepID=UPI0016748156|nr:MULTISPECIES: hypothetical protein [unclassified Polaribacter]
METSYKNTNALYYVVIDLGKEYHNSEVHLHDMHDAYDFSIEYGNSSNRVALFIY